LALLKLAGTADGVTRSLIELEVMRPVFLASGTGPLYWVLVIKAHVLSLHSNPQGICRQEYSNADTNAPYKIAKQEAIPSQ
jgi:hypothetical protein